MKIIKLNAIDSTNTYLKGLIKNSGQEDGTIVIAENQIKGRGQMGTHWKSKAGQSLTFSMFKRFHNLDIAEKHRITFGISIAVKNAMQKLQIPAVTVKWPNDIMSYHRKICGILIENQLEGTRVLSSVIGIGVNVNEVQFNGIPNATSLKLETGNTFNLEEVLHLISENIHEKLRNLDEGVTIDLKSEYERSLFRKNKVSAFENPAGIQFNGMIKGVNDSGELLVETEDEILQSYRLKQIKMLL